MEWMISNWILLLIAALCIGLHFLGRCGKHSEGSDHYEGDTNACSSDGSTTKKGGGCCH